MDFNPELVGLFCRLLTGYVKLNLLVSKIDDRKLVAAAFTRASGLGRTATAVQDAALYIRYGVRRRGRGAPRGERPDMHCCTAPRARSCWQRYSVKDYIIEYDNPIEAMQTRLDKLVAARYGPAKERVYAAAASQHVRRSCRSGHRRCPYPARHR